MNETIATQTLLLTLGDSRKGLDALYGRQYVGKRFDDLRVMRDSNPTPLLLAPVTV